MDFHFLGKYWQKLFWQRQRLSQIGRGRGWQRHRWKNLISNLVAGENNLHPSSSEPRSPAQDSSVHLCSITTSASDTRLTTTISLKPLLSNTRLYFSDGFPHLFNVMLYLQCVKTLCKRRCKFPDGLSNVALFPLILYFYFSTLFTTLKRRLYFPRFFHFRFYIFLIYQQEGLTHGTTVLVR